MTRPSSPGAGQPLYDVAGWADGVQKNQLVPETEEGGRDGLDSAYHPAPAHTSCLDCILADDDSEATRYQTTTTTSVAPPAAQGLKAGDEFDHFEKKEGFDLAVFLPQLVLRLLPPLMLLQLIPDTRPRVDHLLGAFGVVLSFLGQAGWNQHWPSALALLTVLMTLPGAFEIVRDKACRRSSQEGDLSRHHPWKTLFSFLASSFT